MRLPDVRQPVENLANVFWHVHCRNKYCEERIGKGLQKGSVRCLDIGRKGDNPCLSY